MSANISYWADCGYIDRVRIVKCEACNTPQIRDNVINEIIYICPVCGSFMTGPIGLITYQRSLKRIRQKAVEGKFGCKVKIVKE